MSTATLISETLKCWEFDLKFETILQEQNAEAATSSQNTETETGHRQAESTFLTIPGTPPMLVVGTGGRKLGV